MEFVKIKDINIYKSQSVDPSKSPEQIYEVYSVPSFDTKSPEYLRGAEIGSTKVKVKKHDVLLCKINPRINRVWVVGEPCEYPSIASSEWIIIRTENMNPHYLAWYFKSPRFQAMMTSEVTGIGGSLTRAQPKRVAEYPVPVASPDEQKHIIYVFESLQTVINNRRQQLTELDTLVKARFVEMFGEPVSNSKNWDTEKLSVICKAIYGGGTPSKSHPEYFDGNIPWVSPKDMKSAIITDSIDHITEEAIQNSTTKIVPSGAVLMVIRSGILKHTLPVAIAAVDLTVNQDMKAFIVGDRIASEFLMYYFKAIEADVLKAVRGVTADNIDFKEFQQRQIIVPPFSMQEQFAAFVTQVNQTKSVVQKALEEAQTLFDSLMQQYFG